MWLVCMLPARVIAIKIVRDAAEVRTKENYFERLAVVVLCILFLGRDLYR